MPEGQPSDGRHHVHSLLMRESLLDKRVMSSTETPVVRMLPKAHVVKIGGRSIMDAGRSVTMPVIDAIAEALKRHKLVIGTGGGVRSRHVFSVGLDLGLPTGVLAQVGMADAYANAHMLAALLSPYGVVAVPPELFGHLLPFFVETAPGVIFNGEPPFSIWEHPAKVGRIPPHRSDAGAYLLAECFGCASFTLIKDVDGLYSRDPKEHPDATFIPDATAGELIERNLPTLPFDRVLLELLQNARQVTQIRLINGLKPELIEQALAGEPVGSVIRKG